MFFKIKFWQTECMYAIILLEMRKIKNITLKVNGNAPPLPTSGKTVIQADRETAKQFGIKEKAFIQFLMDKKYIYRDKKGKLMPYANKNDGLFEVKECFNDKTQWSGTQTLVTPKGRETFSNILIQS